MRPFRRPRRTTTVAMSMPRGHRCAGVLPAHVRTRSAPWRTRAARGPVPLVGGRRDRRLLSDERQGQDAGTTERPDRPARHRKRTRAPAAVRLGHRCRPLTGTTIRRPFLRSAYQDRLHPMILVHVRPCLHPVVVGDEAGRRLSWPVVIADRPRTHGERGARGFSGIDEGDRRRIGGRRERGPRTRGTPVEAAKARSRRNPLRRCPLRGCPVSTEGQDRSPDLGCRVDGRYFEDPACLRGGAHPGGSVRSGPATPRPRRF